MQIPHTRIYLQASTNPALWNPMTSTLNLVFIGAKASVIQSACTGFMFLCGEKQARVHRLHRCSYSAAQTQLDMRVRATRVTRNITREYHLRACTSTREWCTAHTRAETRECTGGEPRACAHEYSQTNSRVLANELGSTPKRTRESSHTNSRVLAKEMDYSEGYSQSNLH